jgi:1-deoxy-D-xylulose-5-phosphate reductoisomerase
VKNLVVLGSTGSIGESTLAVVRAMQGSFRVMGLSCSAGTKSLAAQIKEFDPEAVAVREAAAAGSLPAGDRPRLYTGEAGAARMVEELNADIVVNGISGAAGLLPSFAALGSGKNLALANKESLVMAGPLLLVEAARRGVRIIPVDSEHAAIFSLLHDLRADEIQELIITASGGAFRDMPADKLRYVTVEDALKHPTWTMGPKITVDSASMANKGLEVIEAHRLFGIGLDKIRVLIHPQSWVHSMVRTLDGTLHAEISTPDMRIPIQNALTYPAVRPNRVQALDLAGKSLSFEQVDTDKYRMLALAYRAAESSAAHTIVYNAANEVAVSAFMAGALSFTGIPDSVERALALAWGPAPSSIPEVLDIDGKARIRTREFIA